MVKLRDHVEKKLYKLESLFQNDIGGRGIGKFLMKGNFARAVSQITDPAVKRILLLTGFPCIRPEVSSMPQETDGPPGLISLAIALGRMRKKVTLVTNREVAPAMRHMKDWLDLKFTDLGIDYFTFEQTNLIDWKNYDHLVAIETAGISADGRYYTISGRDISDLSAGLSDVVLEAMANKVPVTAVGDGGNEVGMGNAYDLIIENGKLAKIASTVCCDNLIVAGVSNWGGDALAVACSIINGDQLHVDEEKHHEILKETVRAGCRDGISFQLAETVDGMPYESILKPMYQSMMDVYKQRAVL